MFYLQRPQANPAYHPWFSLFTLTAVVISGLLIGQLLGLGMIYSLFGLSLEELTSLSTNPQEVDNGRLAMFLLQGVVALFAFLVAPMLYMQWKMKLRPSVVFSRGSVSLLGMVLVITATLTMIFANAGFVEWNQNLEFPAFLERFAEWARQKEDSLGELTVYLTSFASFEEYLLGLVVIAVIPAIGEEFLFRGVVQEKLLAATQNPHTAVWGAAIIFSAIHMQFFGFVPRMLLGAAFGYLYLYSGNLWYPIIAHFLNNGITVTVLYLHRQGFIDMDIENGTESPGIYITLILTLASIALIYGFYRHKKETHSHTKLSQES
ncbi:MAG: CPBP family intramembrane metalloprotease [Cyclobacteriaceae bacterium]|nr:CPBP family intramembrane metalloprotease [Cyclobacteriaceae bacterium]MCH8515634.1 CPBP family intramembrane metalloprotease [Cyclobacteriaceae bacterium]